MDIPNIYKYSQFPSHFRYILQNLQRKQINVKSMQNQDEESQQLVYGIKKLLLWMSKQLICSQVWFEVLERFLELFKLALLPYTRMIFTTISNNPQLKHNFVKGGHKFAFMVDSMIRQIGYGTDLKDFYMYIQKSVLTLLSKDLLYYSGNEIKMSIQDLRFYRFIVRSRKWATRCMYKMNFTVNAYVMRDQLAKYEDLKREEEFISETFLDDLNPLEFNLLKSGTTGYFIVKPRVQCLLAKMLQSYEPNYMRSNLQLSAKPSVPMKQELEKSKESKESSTSARSSAQQSLKMQKPNQCEQLEEGEMSMDDIYYGSPAQIPQQEAKQSPEEPTNEIIELTKEQYQSIMKMRQNNKPSQASSNLAPKPSPKVVQSAYVAQAVAKIQQKNKQLALKYLSSGRTQITSSLI